MNEMPVSSRFPVGRFEPVPELTGTARTELIASIARLPAILEMALDGLDDAQLNTAYRDQGWTVRQVAHHIPDSHLNGYVRFKLALTETQPTIKGYEEGRWAELQDTQRVPPQVSLKLLEALHERWVTLLENLRESDFARTLTHPEMGVLSLDTMLQLYEWHGRHHIAHITALRRRMGWSAVR